MGKRVLKCTFCGTAGHYAVTCEHRLADRPKRASDNSSTGKEVRGSTIEPAPQLSAAPPEQAPKVETELPGTAAGAPPPPPPDFTGDAPSTDRPREAEPQGGASDASANANTTGGAPPPNLPRISVEQAADMLIGMFRAATEPLIGEADLKPLPPPVWDMLMRPAVIAMLEKHGSEIDPRALAPYIVIGGAGYQTAQAARSVMILRKRGPAHENANEGAGEVTYVAAPQPPNGAGATAEPPGAARMF